MKTILLMLLSVWACTSAYCQTIPLSLVGSAGETFKNTSYQLDWSIGELQTETYSATNQIVTQGFHQGIYVITAIKQAQALAFEIVAFPNPTTDRITLKMETDQFENYAFVVVDTHGQILQNGKLSESESPINLSTYSSGSYTLIVRHNGQLLKSFKIIKE